MVLDIQQERQRAHALADLLPSEKLRAIRKLLEVIDDDDDEALTGEDRRALRASREYIRRGGGRAWLDDGADSRREARVAKKILFEPDLPAEIRAINRRGRRQNPFLGV